MQLPSALSGLSPRFFSLNKPALKKFLKAFLIFGKVIFRTLAYLELEAYSESSIFRTSEIFKTLPNIHNGTFCKKYLSSAFFKSKLKKSTLKKVLIFSGNGTF